MSYVFTFIGGVVYALGAVLVGQWLKDRQPPRRPSDAYDEALCREWRIRL